MMEMNDYCPCSFRRKATVLTGRLEIIIFVPQFHCRRQISATIERFKKYCGHSERELLGFGEALAKEHARSGL
jgi:hypothetical protein